GDGANGAECVAAGNVNPRAAIALEARIVAVVPRRSWMTVDAVRVALPDLDHGAAHDPTAAVEHAPRHMRDLSHSLPFLSPHPHQVSIPVSGQCDGIKRPLGLARRDNQRGAGGGY